MSGLRVYKASAGSGKTFTLATEYIKLLISNPMSYRNILAVTFTNKATEEMKMRILSQLYGIWKLLPDSENYIKAVTSSLGVTRQYASKKAGEALSNLIHNYNYFRVQTIDTFFQNVLRNLARELDLTANLRIGLNDYQIEEQAVDQLIQELDTTSVILNWIIGYITSNMEEDKSWNVIGQIKSFGKTIFKDYYKADSEKINNKLSEEKFFENYTNTLRTIKAAAKDRMRMFAETFFDTINEAGLQPDSFSGKSRGISSYFNKLRSDDFSDAKCVNTTLAKHLEDPEKWTTKTSPDRQTIIMLVEDILMRLLQDAEAERSKQWRLFVSADVTLKHLNKLRLLSSIEKKVRSINEESNLFLLSDTQQLLNALIKDSDSPFIFEKIGTQLEHVMIDEFQDTSTIQWDNFKILLEEIMSHSDTTNLIVGDVKQSIYRWRSGDWRLLNGIDKEFQKAGSRVNIETLKTNYRSERNIIEFNNKFFHIAANIEYLAEKEIIPDEAEELKTAYDDVCQEVPKDKTNNGLIKITLLPNENYADAILEEIGKQVDELLEAGISQSKIAILIRANKHIPLIADYFTQTRSDVKIVSDEAFRLDASLAVCTIIQALHLLTHPDDILTKANLAKAYNLILNGERVTVNANNLNLPSEYLEHQEELLDMPLNDLIERIYKIFKVGNLTGQDAYICAFYDKVNEFTKDNSSDIDAFVHEWEECYCNKTIQSDETSGIRLISIHKSKGLEFDNVIIPYCDWMIEMRSGNTLWCQPKEAPFSELPLVPVDYSSKLAETIYAKDYAHEHLQNCVDNLNLLYVAFTRASKNLFVIGKRDARNSRSVLIQEVLPCLSEEMPEATLSGHEEEDAIITFEYGTLALPEAKSEKTSENVFLKQITPVTSAIESFETPIEFKQSNKSREFIGEDDESDKQKTYITTGKVMHNIFSRIRTIDDIPAILKELEFGGILYDENISPSKVKALIENRLSDERVKEWFSPHWQLFNECTIIATDKDGKLIDRRPDRVMTDGNRVIVVDFKFGKPDEEYYNQVRMYMELLKGMGYKNVEGYLWFVYTNKVEEVK